MNVLIFCWNNSSRDRYALVPSHLLEQYDLDAINGKNANIHDKEVGDQISMIFDRLGLCPFAYYKEDGPEPEPGKEKDFINRDFLSEKDLEKYLDPKPPFRVDKVVSIIAD